jgi:serine protease AprX
MQRDPGFTKIVRFRIWHDGIGGNGLGVSFGFTWNQRATRHARAVVATAIALLLAATAISVSAASAGNHGPMLSVIVREAAGAGSQAEKAVRSLGGRIDGRLPIIDGFVASVPAGSLASLARSQGVQSVTPNATVELTGSKVDGFDPSASAGSWKQTIEAINAQELWKYGYRGQGVDVALIDSGVAPVEGIKDHLVNGADLSFESQAANLRYLDTYGHGTHMAGIIAGRDSGIGWGDETHDLDKRFEGVAPRSRIVSVKVATSSGATDVSQVIAAIDWVVQHRTSGGLNIRVLNLSFGTDGTQAYGLDPLAYAAEVAWRKGIVVVVAAGNSNFGSNRLNNPAFDPFVITVGADDTKGTTSVTDDTIPVWSAKGDPSRRPDLVAPGKSVVSLRSGGSFLDLNHPEGKVGISRFFRGSGTSQAAAVVSGAAALLLSQRPSLTPNQVKYLLKSTAVRLPSADIDAQGSGLINLKAARDASTPSSAIALQSYPLATGAGSLELSRGSVHVSNNGVDLTGEKDIFGAAFVGSAWAAASLTGNTWSGGVWNGNTWSGNTWSGNTWAGNTWSGNTWAGNTWSGNTWSGNTWSGNTWSGNTWAGNTWAGNTWSGNTWSAGGWSSAVWGSD